MIMERKLIKIGDGVGIILPKKLLALLDASIGDTLTATLTADGVDLIKADANSDHQIDVADTQTCPAQP
jgi:antitoxin component of MazEF toxin-antitoxin module